MNGKPIFHPCAYARSENRPRSRHVLIFAAALCLLAGCSSGSWWQLGPRGITHCGVPVQYRVRGGFLYKSYTGEVGNCAGTLWDTGWSLNLTVGRSVDVHSESYWPVSTSNPHVLRLMHGDTSDHVATFEVIAKGTATLAAVGPCLHGTVHTTSTFNKPCPILKVTVG